jgi:hypothetical protein
MTWFMVLKVKDVPDELPLRAMLHIPIAMVLAPLILVKLLIARYYKCFTTALVTLGLTIFTLGFVLIASAEGPYLLRRVTIKDISLLSINMGDARIDLKSSEALMQKRCSRCHALDRVVGARKDAQGWLVGPSCITTWSIQPLFSRGRTVGPPQNPEHFGFNALPHFGSRELKELVLVPPEFLVNSGQKLIEAIRRDGVPHCRSLNHPDNRCGSQSRAPACCASERI